jgi:hypothetical protein
MPLLISPFLVEESRGHQRDPEFLNGQCAIVNCTETRDHHQHSGFSKHAGFVNYKFSKMHRTPAFAGVTSLGFFALMREFQSFFITLPVGRIHSRQILSFLDLPVFVCRMDLFSNGLRHYRIALPPFLTL